MRPVAAAAALALCTMVSAGAIAGVGPNLATRPTAAAPAPRAPRLAAMTPRVAAPARPQVAPPTKVATATTPAAPRFDPSKLPSRPFSGGSRFLAKLNLGRASTRVIRSNFEVLAAEADEVQAVWSLLMKDPARFKTSGIEGHVSREDLESFSPIYKLVYRTDDLAQALDAHVTKQTVAKVPAGARVLAQKLAALEGTFREAAARGLKMKFQPMEGPVDLVLPFTRIQESIYKIRDIAPAPAPAPARPAT